MLEIPESYNLAKQLNNTIVAEQGGETQRRICSETGWI